MPPALQGQRRLQRRVDRLRDCRIDVCDVEHERFGPAATRVARVGAATDFTSPALGHRDFATPHAFDVRFGCRLFGVQVEVAASDPLELASRSPPRGRRPMMAAVTPGIRRRFLIGIIPVRGAEIMPIHPRDLDT